MGNRVSKLTNTAKKLSGEGVKIQKFDKSLLKDQPPNVSVTHHTPHHVQSSYNAQNFDLKQSHQGVQSHSLPDEARITQRIETADTHFSHQRADIQFEKIVEQNQHSMENTYVDPRMSDQSFDQAHNSNLNKIMEKVNRDHIDEKERYEEEASTHRFGNALMSISNDIQPIYENTVGDPNSPLALHKAPKSELYANAQKKMKYDDLEGMYKIVDIMNLLKEIRTLKREEVLRKKQKSNFRGKFYSTSKAAPEIPENIKTVDKVLDNYSIIHKIPREDLEIICKHFQYPNHIEIGEKKYGFWHDFSVKNLEIISDDPSDTANVYKANGESPNNADTNGSETNTSPEEIEESIQKRSVEEIEEDVLKELQSMHRVNNSSSHQIDSLRKNEQP